jgi:DNA replicative helicase MCM subunit Mcm2 (Cdc46/Mcm family)
MAELDPALEADVLAAALQMDNRESGDLLEFLAQKLEQSLPQATTVLRSGNFLSKARPVKEITVRFENYHYQLSRGHSLPSAKVMKLVRGVVLKTSEVSVEDWTAGIAQELAALAQRSAQTRAALSQFVLGGG